MVCAGCTVVYHSAIMACQPSTAASSEICKDGSTSALVFKRLPMEQCKVERVYDEEISSKFQSQPSSETSAQPVVKTYENALERYGPVLRRRMWSESIDRTITS